MPRDCYAVDAKLDGADLGVVSTVTLTQDVDIRSAWQVIRAIDLLAFQIENIKCMTSEDAIKYYFDINISREETILALKINFEMTFEEAFRAIFFHRSWCLYMGYSMYVDRKFNRIVKRLLGIELN